MPVLGGARGLIDLPGYDRIAVVALDHEEPISLRGSSARRLAQHLLEGGDVDHTLPAVCAPPPSDVDLLFDTSDPDRIGAMIAEIRDSAPLFQGLRVEASSLARVDGLESQIEAYLQCPAFGVSLAHIDEQGFTDRTGRGIQQLRDRRLTFRLSDEAIKHPELIDDDIRFHLYCASLVFAKAAYEHGTRDDFLDSEAMEFCGRNRDFARAIATPPASRVTDQTSYYRNRLYGIAFGMRAMIPRDDFTDHILKLLPPRVAAKVGASRATAPLFNIAKSNVFEPEEDWNAPDSRVGEHVDLSAADALASGPRIPLRRESLLDNSFAECLIPLRGDLSGMEVTPEDSVSAALFLTIAVDGKDESVWLPAYSEAVTRDDELALRVSLDQSAAIIEQVCERFGGCEAWVEIHLLGHRTQGRGGDLTMAAPIPPAAEEDESEAYTYAEATQW